MRVWSVLLSLGRGQASQRGQPGLFVFRGIAGAVWREHALQFHQVLAFRTRD